MPRDQNYEYSTNIENVIRIRIRNAKFLRMRIFVTNIRHECEYIRYSCRPLFIIRGSRGGCTVGGFSVKQRCRHYQESITQSRIFPRFQS